MSNFDTLDTRLATLLAELHQMQPAAKLQLLGTAMDGLSVREWMNIGDGAADLACGIRYQACSAMAAARCGEAWKRTERAIWEHCAPVFAAACARQEVKNTFRGWRIENATKGVLGMVAERVVGASALAQLGRAWFPRTLRHALL